MEHPPVAADGKPWAPLSWAKAIYMLAKTPTADMKEKFNKVFGPQGYDADEVLDKVFPPKTTEMPAHSAGDVREHGHLHAGDTVPPAVQFLLSTPHAAGQARGQPPAPEPPIKHHAPLVQETHSEKEARHKRMAAVLGPLFDTPHAPGVGESIVSPERTFVAPTPDTRGPLNPTPFGGGN
jgi:hypothetical protein